MRKFSNIIKKRKEVEAMNIDKVKHLGIGYYVLSVATVAEHEDGIHHMKALVLRATGFVDDRRYPKVHKSFALEELEEIDMAIFKTNDIEERAKYNYFTSSDMSPEEIDDCWYKAPKVIAYLGSNFNKARGSVRREMKREMKKKMGV